MPFSVAPCPTLVSSLEGIELILSMGLLNSAYLGAGREVCLWSGLQMQSDLRKMGSFVQLSFDEQQHFGLRESFPIRESLVCFLRAILWGYGCVRPLCRDLTSDQQVVGNSEKSSRQDSEAWFTGAW